MVQITHDGKGNKEPDWAPRKSNDHERSHCRLTILVARTALLVPGGEPAASARKADAPSPRRWKSGLHGSEMVLIPAGHSLWAASQVRRRAAGALNNRYALPMDRTEITQEQYDTFALGNPSHFKGPTLPVEQISWADAALFCNAALAGRRPAALL